MPVVDRSPNTRLPDAMKKSKALLLQEFPNYRTELEQIFDQKPDDVKTALDTLIGLSASDQTAGDSLERITSRDGTGTPKKNNLWAFVEVAEGVAPNRVINKLSELLNILS